MNQLHRRLKSPSFGGVWGGLFFLFIACKKEQAIDINIDVKYIAADSNFTVPAKVKFINNTSGAENFKWTFEGGEPSISTKKDPGTITFNTVGIHKVTLEASSQDDKKLQQWMVKIDSSVQVAFDTAIIGSDRFAPLKVKITNQTKGATSFNWVFNGATPSNAVVQQPDTITFTTAGNHNITLTASNGSGKFILTKTITVLPPLQTNFNIVNSFEDEDYEAPLTATLQNATVSGTNYTWSTTGGTIDNIKAINPIIYFPTEGTYNITLKASNGKETKEITKAITVKPNANLRLHRDIKLGIQAAHPTIGSFYSTKLRTIFKRGNNIDTAGKWIDIVFFGLNNTFSDNKFISPDSAAGYALGTIPMATKTKFINSQEICGCGVSFTATDFDNMVDDMPLRGLTINPTANGWKPFVKRTVPRIVLFQTADGRKGAIKIKDFVADGNNSYIIVDIKIQKGPL